MNQLEIHKKIDAFFETSPGVARIEDASTLILQNDDAKRYFFFKATEVWLEWIWKNGLLDLLNKKAVDITTYSYRLPELEYLTRMAEVMPAIVAEIIIAVPVSTDTFNPEVIDRFFWITGLLPAEQIKIILPEILSEDWVKLMAAFNRSGYEYQKIVEKLVEAKDYESLNILAQIILKIKSKDEFSKSDKFSMSDKFFYLHDISATGLFDAIVDDGNSKNEDSLKIFSNILTQIVDLGEKHDETVFDKTEPFYLLDVNIFELDLDTKSRSHMREDIQNLVAVCRELIRRTMSGNISETRRIYDTYIADLPDSLTCWRLKLYALTRKPDIFKAELTNELFRVFNVGERYFELDGGAEYHEALIAGFEDLDETVKRDYVTNLLKYYGATLDDKKREEWRKRDGLEIVTYIKKSLTPEELATIEAMLGKPLDDGKIRPHPSMGPITSGIVSHKSPFEPANCTIDELIEHLKTDASPKVLKEKYKNDDFLNPRGSEGLGEAILADFKIRRSEYLSKIEGFFDRDLIYPGYIYFMLRGAEEQFRAKEKFTDDEYVHLIHFFGVIKKSGEVKKFETPKDDRHWFDWISVHKILTDTLLEVLSMVKDSSVFKDNRTEILSIIRYLLTIESSPDVEDEKKEDSEPSHVAINSVRGQAYRAFVQFTYNDGNKDLASDVKELFEHVLDTELSNAVRFTVGQFLASFYFRDINYVRSLLPKIFPKDDRTQEKLYFAAWEGYLASSLYKELFTELRPYYEHAIKVKTEEYPERKYLKGLDETLAVHLALAFAHFDFNISDSLFNLFWETPNETRHYEFVSFLGRSCLTRSQAGDAWFRENKVSKEKLIEFWDWILSIDLPIESKAFAGFGFWINPDKEVIDEKIIIKNLPVTLEKSKGDIDWDYGITRRMDKFAEIDPHGTLEVIRNFLLLDDGLNPHRRMPMFSLDSEIKDALSAIYQNGDVDIKKEVADLINTLIEKGSSVFWGLKDVLR